MKAAIETGVNVHVTRNTLEWLASLLPEQMPESHAVGAIVLREKAQQVLERYFTPELPLSTEAPDDETQEESAGTPEDSTEEDTAEEVTEQEAPVDDI